MKHSIRERVLRWLACLLTVEDQTVLFGDLAEENAGFLRSVRAIFNFELRREIETLGDLRIWFVASGLLLLSATVLASVSLSLADQSAVYVWLFANNTSGSLLLESGFWHVLGGSIWPMLLSFFALICWSGCCGILIGRLLKRRLRVELVLLAVLFAAVWHGWRPSTLDLHSIPLARDFAGNAVVFRNTFYHSCFTPLVQFFFVLGPFLYGTRIGQDQRRIQRVQVPLWWSMTTVCIASLVAQGTLWWQMRTWTTTPMLTPHLPSLLPFALSGGIAMLLCIFGDTTRYSLKAAEA